MKTRFCALWAALAAASILHAADPAGLKPLGADGQPLNLDFEEGSLKDWKAEGKAFEKQPVNGDLVYRRRPDMKSEHQGGYWVGTYEVSGDDATGTLTSVPFKVTHPWASFRIGGGSTELNRVEIVQATDKKLIFKVSGLDTETLRPVVVDLQAWQGQEIIVRVIDHQIGGWGHINFDDFKFHAQRPKFANEIDAKTIAANTPPPADAVLFAGLSAAEAVKKATLPPGFKLHLFAGEPDIKQPIAFCLDHRGRVWIAEGYTYPRRAPEGQGKDRILVFEDTDGDHQFDKRTVFKEGLNLISGLEVGFGGVWVGAAPYLMFIPVGDWDNPKPAGEPKILLDGWDFLRDTHETLNTFSWGPDGWLYGCHGVFCPSHVGKPGAPESERQWVDAAVWRYHPTRQVFEVFSEGTSNPWGLDFDEYGQAWIEACVIPHLWHMIQGGRYERQGGEHYTINRAETARNEQHRETRSRKPVFPYVYDDIKTVADHVHWAGNKGPHAGNARSDAAGGGHAHAGMMVYLGDSWPAEYRGGMFMGNIHGQRLNVDLAERRGSGFVGRHGKDFLNFNDTWSQTLNQIYDQSGSVYIIDWYDKNQCHHNTVDGHDRGNGRIYKVVYNDEKHRAVDLQKASDDELVKYQLHQNDWFVRHARRILQERAANKTLGAGTRDALLKILRENPDTTRKLRALWALHVTGGIGGPLAMENLRSPDEWVRAWTVQLIAETTGGIERVIQELMEQNLKPDPDFNKLASRDPSPVVRLYLAAAAQRLPYQLRGGIVTRLLKRSEDAGDHNLPLMIWYAMEALVEDLPGESLDAALGTKLPRILNFTTRRVAAIGSAEARDLIAQKLAGVEEPAKQLDMLSGLSLALRGQRSVPMPPSWDKVETKLSASANADVRALAQSLSLTFGSANARKSLRATLADTAADASARRTALDSLLAAKDNELPPVLQSLTRDASLRAAAIRALASYDDAKTPDALLAVYPQLAPAEKRDALNTLASRAAFARPLMVALEAGRVSAKDLSPDLLRQLRSFKHAEIDQGIAKVYGAVNEISADKQAEIEKYKRVYRAGGSTPGEASRGRAVYAKTCGQCHSLFDVGGKVGPDLTGSNRGDLDYILQNMVDPNAVIPNEYRSTSIEMKDDRSIIGIVKQSDDKAVTVVTANDTLTLPRGEIKSQRQSEISMMPEGLLAQLTDQEIRDLIYYLSRPGQVPLPGEK